MVEKIELCAIVCNCLKIIKQTCWTASSDEAVTTGKGYKMSHKYVYLFSEGNGHMRELLGGKGANLAEMTNLGMPVPQGFTITTEACTQYYCPVSPGPFPAFLRRVPLLPVLSGTCPFCSRPSRRSPPAPVPCRYPAARPLHPPASCGQRDGFSGCPLETCRFWTSGHRGPKDCPARYPRPQTAGVGMVRGKALPVQPVRGDCPRYPPSAPAFENSVCPVSFR